jgi:hypothetical protein
VSLYGYDNSSAILKIPAEYSGRYVRSVYDYAFEDNTSITKLDFSETSKKFWEIGVKSFAGSALEGELNLPASIRSIGLGAFQGCNGITIANINCSTSEIPAQMFNRCENLETVYLPSRIETIGKLAFANCPKLRNVYFPFSVTSINDSAFKDSDDVFFNVYSGSYAHEFAVSHNIPYEFIDYIMGDANNDRLINIQDVTLIQKYKAGLKQLTGNGLKAADVTGDGEVSVRDATQIQRYLANIITDF